MCGVSSFAFTFIYEALVKRKAFSVTEKEMFAFFQNRWHWNTMYAMFAVPSTCVSLEYAMGICCLLLRLSMIVRMRFWRYCEVRKSNILVRLVGFWCFSVWYWESGLWNLLPSDVFWALKYLRWPSEAKAIANRLNIHRFKLKVKRIAWTYVTFV